MACGLPVIASDLAVHREICGDAALFFPAFSPDALADRLSRLASAPDDRRALSIRGLDRCQTYSWESHVRQLLTLAQEMLTELKPRQSESRAVGAA
jgi:glycosyltransferase involved in cell wall biosynthesis